MLTDTFGLALIASALLAATWPALINELLTLLEWQHNELMDRRGCAVGEAP